MAHGHEVLIRLSVVVVLSTALGAAAGAQRATVWDGIYTTGQATRGKSTYLATCTGCHTDSATAPALVGKSFVSTWDGQTVRDLYSRLRTTMPADNPGTLSENAALDIVAYLLEANGFPAGEAELKGGTERLQAIQITGVRPQ